MSGVTSRPGRRTTAGSTNVSFGTIYAVTRVAPSTPGATCAPLRARGCEALVEDPQRQIDLVGCRHERRDDARDVDVRPGGEDHQLASERLGKDALRELGIG